MYTLHTGGVSLGECVSMDVSVHVRACELGWARVSACLPACVCVCVVYKRPHACQGRLRGWSLSGGELLKLFTSRKQRKLLGVQNAFSVSRFTAS